MKDHVLMKQSIDSFEKWMQFAVGSTTDLEPILSNLSTDEIKEEIKLYAIEVAKQALVNASGNFDAECNKWVILSENNIPKLD